MVSAAGPGTERAEEKQEERPETPASPPEPPTPTPEETPAREQPAPRPGRLAFRVVLGVLLLLSAVALLVVVAPGLLSSQVAGNERAALECLRTLAGANSDFRNNDRDVDGINNFWTEDVQGLYDLAGPSGVALKLIDITLARADANAGSSGARCASVPPFAPRAGYCFAAIESYESDDRELMPYNDDGMGHHISGFAFAAYPADYPKTGRLTFIISEQNTVWKKDTRGRRPEFYPADPPSRGWELGD
jgi:hypothetical protein